MNEFFKLLSFLLIIWITLKALTISIEIYQDYKMIGNGKNNIKLIEKLSLDDLKFYRNSLDSHIKEKMKFYAEKQSLQNSIKYRNQLDLIIKNKIK